MQPLTQLSKPHARPEAMAASRRTRNLRGIRSVEFFSRGRRPCSEQLLRACDAAEDWRSRLNPTERACLERIEATEGQISEIKTVQASDRPGTFSLLLEVDRAGEPVKFRCQGTMRLGGEQVTDVTRE